MLQDWLVNEYTGGAKYGMANPNIDGFFIGELLKILQYTCIVHCSFLRSVR